MNKEKTNTTTKTEQPTFVKRIGRATYTVKIHFSTTSRETMNDKINRLIRNEVSQICKM